MLSGTTSSSPEVNKSAVDKDLVQRYVAGDSMLRGFRWRVFGWFLGVLAFVLEHGPGARKARRYDEAQLGTYTNGEECPEKES